MNLLCTKVALNYDSLVEEGKTAEEIYSLALSKINNDNENKQKIKAMLSLGEQYGAVDKAVEFIKNGKDLETFKTELLDMQAKKALNANGKYGQIGIETKEARNFSFSRLINAVVNPNDRTAQNAAAFEFEACNEAAKKYGRTQSENGNGLRIPFEALSAPLVDRNASNELTTTDGDALITINVRSHPYFRAEGKNIVMDLPVSMKEAVLGAKVIVPTISGKVSVKIPAYSSSGEKLRLKGKGIKTGDSAGDEIINLVIMAPKAKDAGLEAALNNLPDEQLRSF